MGNDAHAAARALREIAVLLEARGDSSFKVRAYALGAERLESLEDPLERLVSEGRLRELPGIGKALAEKIEQFVVQGRIDYLENLRAELPPGIFELTSVPEVGPKKALLLARELRVTGIDELEVAAREGRVAGVKGFGARTETRILEGIVRLRRLRERRPLGEALEVAEDLVAFLKEGGLSEVRLCGSARRMRDTVSDLDLVVVGEASVAAERIASFPGLAEVTERGPTKISVRMGDGLQVDLRVVPRDALATAVHHFTGSKAHHLRLRGRARERGLSVSEYGVFREDGTRLEVESEAELYGLLGLPEIPPELREDAGEIEAAQAGRLPRLLERAEVQGMLHCHTGWSDGEATVAEMARAARLMGLSYLTITDHSQSSHYARGLTPERLRRQREEVEKAREELPGIRILHGSEVDVLLDGSLDFDDDTLAWLEVVIGSVHTGLQLDEAAQTRRLVKALGHPLLSWLGHPTGRLLGVREPSPVNMEKVVEAAAERGKAIEVNGSIQRMDLCAEHVRLALRRGARLVVSADAHSVSGLAALDLAVGTARRGWATRADVLNTLPAGDFLRAIGRG